jgi:hypothetical protein
VTGIGFDPAWDDLDEPSFYCQHGTYIGSPGGPDYMCGWCEDGISVAEMRQSHAAQAERREVRRAESFDRLVVVLQEKVPEIGWRPDIADWLVRTADTWPA